MINCVIIKCLWLSFVPDDTQECCERFAGCSFLYYVEVKMTNIIVVELNIKI
jgi:hypothetical protein